MVLSPKKQSRNKAVGRKVSPVSKPVQEETPKGELGLSVKTTANWEEYEYHLERIAFHIKEMAAMEERLSKRDPKKVKCLRRFWKTPLIKKG